MYTIIGTILIYIAVLLAIFTYILHWKLKNKFPSLHKNIGLLLIAITGSLWGAYLLLIIGFIQQDYSLVVVYSFSDNSMTIIERIMSTWASRQGVMMLWAAIMATITLVSYNYLKQVEASPIKDRLFSVLFFFNALIISFIMSTRPPPFETQVAYGNGLGLTPSLQSFWMQVHPPVAFLAYSAFIYPFAYSIALLSLHSEGHPVSKKYHWLNDQFMLIGWGMTTLFIIAGSIWGYEENWSGFWAWDPVEVASLVMWLASTLYFHVKSQVSDNHILRYATAGLGWVSVAFSSFIVRSGLLSGLHSYVGGAQMYVFGSLLLGSLLTLLYAISKTDGKLLPDYLFNWSKHNSKPKLFTFWVLVFLLGANVIGLIMQIINVLTVGIDEIPYEYYIGINGICLFALGVLLVFCEINYEVLSPTRLSAIFVLSTVISSIIYFMNHITAFSSLILVSILTGSAMLLLINMVTALRRTKNPRKFSIQLTHFLIVLLILTYTVVDYNTESVSRSFNQGDIIEIDQYDISLNGSHTFVNNQYVIQISVYQDGELLDIVELMHGSHNGEYWTSGDWIILPFYDLHFRSTLEALPGIVGHLTPINLIIYRVPFANYFRILFFMFTFTVFFGLYSSQKRRPIQ